MKLAAKQADPELVDACAANVVVVSDLILQEETDSEAWLRLKAEAYRTLATGVLERGDAIAFQRYADAANGVLSELGRLGVLEPHEAELLAESLQHARLR